MVQVAENALLMNAFGKHGVWRWQLRLGRITTFLSLGGFLGFLALMVYTYPTHRRKPSIYDVGRWQIVNGMFGHALSVRYRADNFDVAADSLDGSLSLRVGWPTTYFPAKRDTYIPIIGFHLLSYGGSLPTILPSRFWPEWRFHRCFSVAIRLWFLTLLFAIRPLLVLIRTLKKRNRKRMGLCTHCGYDLAGSVSGRCPECGAVAQSSPSD
ncbi:MAG: hypothetical protein AABZ47_05230 [Planctomycetota bacterium]